MPYDARGLMPLLATSPFAVWHYRTSDNRADVMSAGYFSAAAGQLRPGHLVILQAGDAMTFLPVRDGGTVGDGLVLDTALAPQRAECSASIHLGARGTATAVLHVLELDAPSNPSQAGEMLTAGATVTGPSRALRFTLVDASGNVVSGPVQGSVSFGRAEVELPAPRTGDGYRLRVLDVDEPSLSRMSSLFSVLRSGTGASGLLTEGGDVLRSENGDRLLL